MELLGLYGITGIRWPLSLNANYRVRFLQDYRGAWVTLNTSPTVKNNRWTPPLPSVFKINVDGATSKDGRNSNVGAIIRDSCGVVIATCGKYLQGRLLVSEVEALAVESGILLARDMKIT